MRYIINPTKSDIENNIDRNFAILNTNYFTSETLAEFKWLEKISQPDNFTIAHQLLWGLDEYVIKLDSRGGYISTLITTICENNIDRDVILLKKWGETLDDVYISYDEVKELYLKHETKAQKKERIEYESIHLIKKYIREYFLGNDTEVHYDNILKAENKDIIRKYIDKIIIVNNADIRNYEKHKDIYITTKNNNKKGYYENSIVELTNVNKLLTDILQII